MRQIVRIGLVAASVCAVTAGGGAAFATEPVAIPPAGFAKPRTVHQLRTGMLAAGAVTFGLSWAAAAVAGEAVLVVTADGCDRACGSPAADRMFIPIAGPLLAGSQPGARTAFGFPTWSYYTWSVVEAVGAAMMVAGLIGHEVPEPEAASPPRPALTIIPTVSKGLSALALNLAW
jgi:hypothetical protein